VGLASEERRREAAVRRHHKKCSELRKHSVVDDGERPCGSQVSQQRKSC
jgi:hypothetical protein